MDARNRRHLHADRDRADSEEPPGNPRHSRPGRIRLRLRHLASRSPQPLPPLDPPQEITRLYTAEVEVCHLTTTAGCPIHHSFFVMSGIFARRREPLSFAFATTSSFRS